MIYFISDQRRIPNDKFNICTIELMFDFFIRNNIKYISVDTETTGFNPHTSRLLSIQIGTPETQFVIDASNCKWISYVKPLLESTECLILMHNAKFDLRFLYKHNIYPEKIYDTFLAECVLTTGYTDLERDLSLKGIAFNRLGVTLTKELRGVIHFEGLSDRVIEYGAKDVMYLEPIMKQQLIEISELKLNNILNLENKVVKVFAKMEYDGVPINTDKWKQVASRVITEKIKIEDELDEIIYNMGTKSLPETNRFTKYCNRYIQGVLFDDMEIRFRKSTINWASNQQKLKLLSEDLNIKLNSVDDRSLRKARDKHKIIELLLEHSKYAKLESSFGLDFLKLVNHVTKRVHPDYWQILSTGRISVSKPNVNQIPRKGELGQIIRSAFEAPEGYKFVGGDYSGYELMIIAELSQDPVWVNAFKEGQDLHSLLCSLTFDIPIDKVKDPFPYNQDITYREVQKTINFGLAYGMTEYKLSDTTGMTKEQAKEVIKLFFKRVPEVYKFLFTIGYLGKTRGYIKTASPFNRIRWFKDWKDALSKRDEYRLREIERASKNTPIQGTNADLIKVALVDTYEEIQRNDKFKDVQIVLSVYDEIQTLCKEELAEDWKDLLQRIMIESAQVVIKSIPVVVDVKISDCWTK